MRRTFIGIAVVLHGLAHTAVGMRAGETPQWYVTLLWGAAMLGYLVAGIGILRTPGARKLWRISFGIATLASPLLIVILQERVLIPGFLIDLLLLILVMWAAPLIDRDIAALRTTGLTRVRHPLMHRIVWSLALMFLAFAGVVVVTRQLSMTWGTTRVLRAEPLPGDDLVLNPGYRIDHSIVIHAPTENVWPWIVQMGQDRAGFYSYSWLERAFGARITNSDVVRAEWQQRTEGDLVRAVQPNYLGGLFGREVGWKITRLVPSEVMILENWGAFVLRPIDSITTRFTVRTRGAGKLSLAAVALSPIDVFMFEPAHFIMEQKMLRGIRDRAERAFRLERVCDPTIFTLC